jgi:hypothetical protein
MNQFVFKSERYEIFLNVDSILESILKIENRSNQRRNRM